MLEVVYTFPLPHQAVLLGFASELNGARKAGTIVARREAELVAQGRHGVPQQEGVRA